jgi:parvulin-like peptidyl-prolyl isomerase
VTKRILAVLVVLLLAGSVGLVAGCGGNLPKSAVAKVGDKIITQKDFEQRVADFSAQYAGQIPDKTNEPEAYKAFQQDVLEFMVVFEIASQKALELKIAVTDEDVQKEIDSIKEQSFEGDQAKFDQALTDQGITLDQLKRSYRESMLMQKVYDEVTKDVSTVPDADLQAYYDENKDNYFLPETRIARHILIAPVVGRADGTTSTTSTTATASPSTTAGSTPPASSSTTTTAAPTDADWNVALETAKKVRDDLTAGADWTAEAKTYSDDPGSKEKGGDLGTVSKGEMVKEFEDAVFSLKKDEISQPIKTAYGYHVIQVTEITEAKQYTLDEVKEEITGYLLSDKKGETWRAWVDQQKQAAPVIYADDWQPATTTTTAAPTATTSGPGDSTATSAGETPTSSGTETTTAPSSTATTAGASITTAAPTTTTAKP